MERLPVTRYLSRYAEPESRLVPDIAEKKYDHCLVIPCYQENWSELRQVWQKLAGRWLIILVINSPAQDDITLTLYRDILAHLNQGKDIPRTKENVVLGRYSSDIDILLVDCCSQGYQLDPSRGVGLARKKGADIALALIETGTISQPLIYNSDADARLPDDYGRIRWDADVSAWIYPFRHYLPNQGGNTIAAENHPVASLLYEIHLFHYAAGLKFAGSPYGFTTLGSTMVVSAEHYARVRGFPRKNAAEDFYLLNKLAKTGQIQNIQTTPLQIMGRLSTRVPFGTGRSVLDILKLKNPLADYTYYHPDSFTTLKSLLSVMARMTSPDSLDLLLGELPSSEKILIEAWIDSSGFVEAARKGLANSRSPQVFRKFLKDWFDGFRTLKFVHFLRNQTLVPGYQPVSLMELIHHHGISNSLLMYDPEDAPFSMLKTFRDHLARLL